MRKWLLLLVIPLGMALFFGGFALHARRVIHEAQLPKEAQNAVKHAGAAEAVYHALASLHVPEAGDKVIQLGILSERFEQWTKWRNPDSTLEMMKDSYNNIAGVAAAEWSATPGNHCVEPVLVALVRGNLLKYTPDDLHIKHKEKARLAQGRDVAEMVAWVDAHRDFIRAHVMTELNKCRED